MSPSKVAEMVERALLTAEPNWAACPGGPYPDAETQRAYAADQLRQFRNAQLSPPRRESVYLEQAMAGPDGVEGWQDVWFVTLGQQSVFYDEFTQSYGVAWDTLGKNDRWYTDLGFRDDDPLELFNA